MVFAQGGADGVQQHEGDTGTTAFPEGNGRDDRSVLHGTVCSCRIPAELRPPRMGGVALHDRQPETMEGWPAEQGGGGAWQATETDGGAIRVHGQPRYEPQGAIRMERRRCCL